MSGRKRPGPFEDSDSDANDPDSSQSSARKRRRGSDGSAIPSSPPSDGERQSPPTTPPSDIESDDDDEDDDAEIEATQQATHVEPEDNQPAEYGILEAVHVVNFMCHKNEKWDLSPLINFMCGKNGSGKSAILTAIVICLGGKASGTGRGSALKDFIRHGSNSASVTCYLKNQGQNAFRNDEYGNTISVERYWSTGTNAGFKIRNAAGKTMSTKKGDLEEILDHYCLQIENPLNVLSQDLARSFIASSNAGVKYKFFLKGVLLEQLDQDYKLIEEKVDSMAPKILQGEEDLAEKKRLSKAADRKLQESRKLDGSRERLAVLRHQCIWAQVEQAEAHRDRCSDAVNENNAKIDEAQQEKTRLEEAVEQAQQILDQKNQHYAAEQAKLEDARSDKNGAAEKVKEAKDAQTTTGGECGVVKGDLNNARKAVAAKQSQIQAEEARLAEVDGGGAARRLRELHDLESTAKEANTTYEECRATRPQYVRDCEKAQQKLNEAKEALTAQQTRVADQKKKLQDIQKAETNVDTKFVKGMSNLLQAINNETRFRERPVGPIGKHIKVLDQRWAEVLEKIFGGTPNGFIVTSRDDQDIFLELTRKLRLPHVKNFLDPPKELDVSHREPDEGFLTVLRALEIDHPLVRSQLIISHKVESAILIPKHNEAKKIMNVTRPSERPRNVQNCFTFMEKKPDKALRLTWTNGTPAQDPVDSWTGKLRMNGNLEDQIRFNQQHVADEESRLAECKVAHQQHQNAYNATVQALKDHDKEVAHLKTAMQKAAQDVDDMQANIDQDTVAGGKLDALRAGLREAEKDVETKSALYVDAVNADDKSKEAVDAAQQELADAEKRWRVAQANADKAKSEVQKADQARQKCVADSNACGNRIADAKKDIETYVRHLEAAEAEVREYIDQAHSNHNERVPIPAGETYDSLDKKFERLVEQVNAANARMGGDAAEIERKAADALETYTKAKHDYDGMKTLKGALTASHTERVRRWKFFRQMIGWRARSQFIYLLSERGFRGKLIMDHVQHQLDLLVEPDITKRDGSGRSSRTLSGGEKSFSQICLLLALWEAMGSPLRCLDEFDVFMDAVNRNMSVNLLIHAARQSQGRQYIMISPGTKSDIKPAPDVHAFEVAPPERGQQRLNFQRGEAA